MTIDNKDPIVQSPVEQVRLHMMPKFLVCLKIFPNHPSISSYLVVVDGNIFFVGGRTRSKRAVEPERPNMDS